LFSAQSLLEIESKHTGRPGLSSCSFVPPDPSPRLEWVESCCHLPGPWFYQGLPDRRRTCSLRPFSPQFARLIPLATPILPFVLLGPLFPLRPYSARESSGAFHFNNGLSVVPGCQLLRQFPWFGGNFSSPLYALTPLVLSFISISFLTPSVGFISERGTWCPPLRHQRQRTLSRQSPGRGVVSSGFSWHPAPPALPGLRKNFLIQVGCDTAA